MQKKTRLGLALSTLALASACGGGSGSSGTKNTRTRAAASAPSTSAPGGAAPSSGSPARSATPSTIAGLATAGSSAFLPPVAATSSTTGVSPLTTVATTTPATTPPAARPARFAYVANEDGGDVSVFQIGAGATPSLAPKALVSAGKAPRLLAASGQGQVLSLDTKKSELRSFTVDATTGLLAPRASIALVGTPSCVAISPQGNAAWVADTASKVIHTFSIDPLTGAIAPLGSTVRTDSKPVALALDPKGELLFCANAKGDRVTVYLVQPNGTLQQAQKVKTGDEPVALAVHPTGDLLLVVHENDRLLVSLRIDRSTGKLTPLAKTAVGKKPVAVGVRPQGDAVYVVCEDDETLEAFELDPKTGVLAPQGVTLATGKGPETLAVDPAGRFVLVVNNDSADVTLFKLSQNKGKPAKEKNVGAGAKPRGIVLVE